MLDERILKLSPLRKKNTFSNTVKCYGFTMKILDANVNICRHDCKASLLVIWMTNHAGDFLV